MNFKIVIAEVDFFHKLCTRDVVQGNLQLEQTLFVTLTKGIYEPCNNSVKHTSVFTFNNNRKATMCSG